MEEVKLLNNAFNIYNLDNRESLEERMLKYILNRLIVNRSSIEQMIILLKENITYQDIIEAFMKASEERNLKDIDTSYSQGINYYTGLIPKPVGNIVIETNNVLDIVKYFVLGIKTRNTITISQTEYLEFNLSNLILVIFSEALAKFGISRNTLMIIPYEEVDIEDFDEVITLDELNEVTNIRDFSDLAIIYKEDDFFNEDIEEEKERLLKEKISYKIVEGKFNEVVEKINKLRPSCVSIYTKDSKLAYEFINLVKAENVFVNASLVNKEVVNKKKNKLYYIKKIIVPSDKILEFEDNKEVKEDTKASKENLKIEDIKTSDNNTDDEVLEFKFQEDESNTEDNKLIEVVNPWYKRIFNKIKEWFFKK